MILTVQSNDWIHMPNMVSNYLYAVSVEDEVFIRVFESMWKDYDRKDELFKAIREESFTVKDNTVYVEVPNVRVEESVDGQR